MLIVVCVRLPKILTYVILCHWLLFVTHALTSQLLIHTIFGTSIKSLPSRINCHDTHVVVANRQGFWVDSGR